MKFSVMLYRLVSSNEEIEQILNYNFFDYEDSNFDFFWRNLIELEREEYIKQYSQKLNKYINILKEAKFDLISIDLSRYISNYTLNVKLNTLEMTQNIDIKEDYSVDIKENDLIVVKEDDRITFIGFVINSTTTEAYGSFRVQSITLSNIGYLYKITNVAVNWALAQYAVSGLDAKEINLPLFQNEFNNKNIFQIIDEIYTGIGVKNEQGYFYASSKEVLKEEDSKYYLVKQFEFDLEQFKNFKSFNTIFIMLKTLQMYIERYEGKFIWAEVEHGEHKVYNELIASTFELFVPSFQNISKIFDDIFKNSFYHYFIDFDGKLILRPPLYNYLPFSILEEKEDRFVFKKNHEFYISANEILEDEFEYNNSELKTRTDAKWVWPYIGEIDWAPSFFIDMKALVKYGFRNEPPYTNPNAVIAKLATLLACIINITENSITRAITIKVKFDTTHPNYMFKFKIGRLYYLEKYKSVGYLVNMTRVLSVDEYPYFELTFSYLRKVKFDVEVNEKNVIDLISIYNRYGIFEKITDRKISKEEFLKIKEEYIKEFKERYKGKKIPGFKVFPTILDFIELTYRDTKVYNAIKKISKNIESDETNMLVGLENNYLMIRDFKIKFQRYFDYEKRNLPNGDAIIELKTPKNLFGTPSKAFTPKNISAIYAAYLEQIKAIGNTPIIHGNFNYTKMNSALNFDIWQCSTLFTLKDFGFIKQKLFNRIMECNEELRRFCAIDADYKLGQEEINIKREKLYPIHVFSKENRFFKIEDITAYNDFRYRIANEKYKKFDVGDYIIHPQLFFNFEFLRLNVITDYQKYESEIDINTTQKTNLLKAHKEGRAIDVILPYPNSLSLLYPIEDYLVLKNKNIINQVFYKKDFIDFIEGVFKNHFDVVEKFDVRIYLFEKNPNINGMIKNYLLFHLEVYDDNYLNIMTEFF